MRCAVVSCVFPPEPVVSASTSHDVAQGLLERGHEVTVIAPFPSRPAGRLYEGYRRRLFDRTEADGGAPVVRCFSTVSRSSTLASRAAENLSFGLSGALAVLRSPRPDVIYSNTWPVLATGLLVLAARWRRVPVVISVQDVYPEGLVSQGRLSADSTSFRILRRIDRAIAGAARQLIVISQNFYELYDRDRGVDEDRLHLIYNWGEDRPRAAPDRVAEFRRNHGWTADDRVVAYGGNIGVAAGVEDIIEAVSALPAELRPKVLLAGEGSLKAECQRRASAIEGIEVVFHAPYRPEDNPLVLGGADVLVLPTRGEQSMFSIPSKLISYLLSGRPVVAAALPESDLAGVIHGAGCGWVVPPDRPDLLAEKLQEVCRLATDQLSAMGASGREWALVQVTRAACLPRVLDIVESAAGGRLHVPDRAGAKDGG
jgi:glycosyltransferase involved in cell wall biosynthesis